MTEPDQQETTVFLVDDHTIMREGLRHILAQVPGIKIVGEEA
ncbi:MAG: DNA-binding response regulator, partial [Spirochaetia bacterium]|nr:DNA-binding response regulator [Spirochaetia bacterium]